MKPRRYEVDPLTGCWEWLLHRTPKGYGTVRQSGRRDYAHRVYYERANGPIPDGLQIDHLCRNPACVNPDHLELVTSAENTRRGRIAKVTHEQVRAIREDRRSHPVVAAEYGLTVATVGDIRRGRSWRTPDMELYPRAHYQRYVSDDDAKKTAA